MTHLNLYMHGYIIVPILDIFLRKNIFDLIRKEKHSFSDLTRNTDANPGPFNTCFAAFEALHWIKKTDNKYELTADLPKIDYLPDFATKSYSIPYEEYFFKEDSVAACNDLFEHLDLKEFINFSSSKNYLSESLLTHFLDGALLLPLFYFIKKHFKIVTKTLLLDSLEQKHKENVINLFLLKKLGTYEKNKIHLTISGQNLINSIENCGVTLSYRPLLKKISQLVFDKKYIEADIGANDTHVARTLNVIGSGSQHGIFFKDFQMLLKTIFSKETCNSKNLTVVDMGCGDGTLLKECYQTLAQNKKISLVGVDYSTKSLSEAHKTLMNYPHELLQGNIAFPYDLKERLKKLNTKNDSDFLHIRSFLDHDRPYTQPKNTSQAINRSVIPYKGCYIDDLGNIRPNNEVIQSLVEYFKEWSNVLDDCGLVTLEVFSLPSNIIHKYLEQTESLHFDIYHSLSKQMLVEAHVYMMAAAEAGLFPSLETFKKYPNLLPYARITLQHFVKKNFIIRNAFLSDTKKLILFTKENQDSVINKEIIENLIKTQPEQQYILEVNDKIVGVVYTSRLESLIQMEAINLLPAYYTYAFDLVSFSLINSLIKNGIKETYIPNYIVENTMYFNDEQRSYFKSKTREINKLHNTTGDLSTSKNYSYDYINWKRKKSNHIIDN